MIELADYGVLGALLQLGFTCLATLMAHRFWSTKGQDHCQGSGPRWTAGMTW